MEKTDGSTQKSWLGNAVVQGKKKKKKMGLDSSSEFCMTIQNIVCQVKDIPGGYKLHTKIKA